jgi:hypothetical protein
MSKLGRYISYSTSMVMDHYRVMQTVQICACGERHKGSFASEVFVVCFVKDKPELGATSFPVREVLRRYGMLLGIPAVDCMKFLPELPTKIVTSNHNAVNIPVCAKCANYTWLNNIPNWDPTPAMLPVDYEDLTIAEQKVVGNPKNRVKSRSVRIKEKVKPASLKSLLAEL